MTASPLRLGIAGANPERGWARDTHFPALAALPGLEVFAVSARTQAIADAAAAAFGASRAHGDSLGLARDPDVDIVVVTVKVPEHRAIVLAALEAGKHVLCEWPLAVDLAEARELAEAADRAGTHVAIGLQGAGSQAVEHAARLVAEGAIGRPLRLRVVSATAGWAAACPPHYEYLQDRRNGATLATIAGGHTLAMVAAVVGAVTEVSACNSILCPIVTVSGTDRTVARTCADHMMLHTRHDSGCVANIEIVGGDFTPLTFELVGTTGRLAIRGHHPGGYQCGELTVECTAGAPQPAPEFPTLSDAAVNVARLYRRFESDIRTGRRTVADFRDAVRLTELLQAIDIASDEGRAIAPEYGRAAF